MIRKKISYALLVCCLGILVTSCKDEDKTSDLIVGTWKLTAVQVDGNSEDISTKADLIQFQANSIFQSYNSSAGVKTRGGWSYEGNMLNISLDLPAAYYIESVNSTSLELKRYDIKEEGGLQTTLLFYEKANDDLIP